MIGLRVILVACLAAVSSAHVRLTWPPARTFALDFLDNSRTAGPCGMPSSEDGPETTFAPEAMINVTWHLAYSHRGGYRLEILERENGTVLHLLTPDTEGTFYGRNDSTSQIQPVMLPNLADGAYTLRLLRNAAEWGTPNNLYQFWSCADIKVMAGATCNGGTCSNRGQCEGGMCTCDGLASGEACQYVDECMNEEGCSNNGECVDLGATTYPRRQCFCNPGYFGKDCSMENPAGFVDAQNYDFSGHYKRMVDERFTVYYKVMEDIGEIEIGLKVMGTTWVGFGWRPDNITSSCQNWPVEYWTGNPSAETEAEPGPESEATAEPNAEPTAAPTGRRRRSPDEVRVRVVRQTVEEPDQEWQCIPGVGPVPEGEPEPEGTPETNPEGEPTPEPESEPTPEPEATSEPEPEGEPGPGRNLHAMDCMDLTIGMAIGSKIRVHDYYTRDRSTPRTDDFYGGTNSLTAAIGWQGNGETIIVYRRKLMANEMTDHSIIKGGKVTAIWARGQEYGRYVHNPPSGLEVCMASDYTFYKRDELKYHGNGDQRGIIVDMDFFADPEQVVGEGPCNHEHTIPEECEGDACDYRLRITYMEDDDSFDVKIMARIASNQWTGVGFSRNGAMVGSDAVLAWLNETSGMVVVRDYQLNGKSAGRVIVDSSQDIMPMATSGMSYNNGVLNVAFNRRRNTGDSSDFTFTDAEDGCAMLLLPKPGNGAGIVIDGRPQYHTETPMVKQKTCIKACSHGSRVAPTILTLIVALGAVCFTSISKFF